MILNVLGLFALAEAAAAAVLAAIVYAVGRRSAHPVPARTAFGIGLMVALPVLLLYLVAWICVA
jgi:hypothetical protein